MVCRLTLEDAVSESNTGLDAIKRAPIVERDTGLRCARIQDVSQSKKFIDWGFSEVEFRNYDKFQLKRNDILIARTGGSIGVNIYIREDLPSVYNNGLIRIRVKEEKYCSKYVYYLLQSEFFKLHINAIAFSTSAQPNMKIRDFLRFEFVAIPLVDQLRISDHLSSLDNKIESNRKMNETLEGMAQALFKSWFVDFDPVIDNTLRAGNPIPEELKAKAEIRKQQMESGKAIYNEEIALKFPDSFCHTDEMGWIPEGWNCGSLKDVCFVKGGYAFKGGDFCDAGVPVIKIKNIQADKTIDISNVQYVSEEIASKANAFSLETGDLLMAMTGATVGKFGMLVSRNKYGSLLNQRVAKFYPLPEVSEKQWYVYCILRDKANFDYIVNVAHGSAQPNISADGIMSLPIVKPAVGSIRLFNDLNHSLFQKIINNRSESETLTGLRDALLPKLISGELRIPDAEKLVEKEIA